MLFSVDSFRSAAFVYDVHIVFVDFFGCAACVNDLHTVLVDSFRSVVSHMLWSILARRLLVALADFGLCAKRNNKCDVVSKPRWIVRLSGGVVGVTRTMCSDDIFHCGITSYTIQT